MKSKVTRPTAANSNYWEKIYSMKYSEFFFYFRKIVVGLNFSYNELFRIVNATIGNIQKKTMVELGCAPGITLVDFQRRFGIIPFGVEYTHNGILLTQEVFSRNSISIDHAIRSDIFSGSFQEENARRFEIVTSLGLIEHFDNPEEAIQCHLNILQNGGYLVIMIPNLTKFNGIIAGIMNKDCFSLHNSAIMNLIAFKQLFSSFPIDAMYCNYYGTINLGLFNADTRLKMAVLLFFHAVQFCIINPALFLLGLFNVRFNSRYFSPYMLFIGKKRS